MSESGPGTEGLALMDADSGDGRDGEDANADSGAGDLAKPGEAEAVLDGGGPNGSRKGDEDTRVAGGDWIDVDRADLIGTGLA